MRALLAALFLLASAFPALAEPPPIAGIWLALAGNHGSVARIAHGAGLNPQEIEAVREPFVDGAYLSDFWSTIEPAPGRFDFSALDRAVAQVTQAGKKLRIGIRAGANSPDWLFSEVPTYTTVNAVNTGGCRALRIPMPFDTTYRARFGEMVRALGAHYAGNPAMIGVIVTGINRSTEELWAPPETGRTVRDCQTPNDVAALQRFGWTEEKLVAAWTDMLSQFAHAFPSQLLILDGCGESPIPNNSMPAIGWDGSYDPHGADVCSRYLLPTGYRMLGSRFAALNASWQVGSFNGVTRMSYHGIGPVNDFAQRQPVITGFQTSRILAEDDYRCMPHCDPSATLAEMVAELRRYSNAYYIEAMSDDLVNPALAPQWTALREWLRSKPALRAAQPG